MLSYTFYIGFLSNETLEWRQLHCDAVLYILYWIACPIKHWNEDSSIVMLSYTFYMGFLSNETLEWRHLHCDAVLYILYGILVQWNTGMMTAPLWCCLRHFIWDSCPMKHWNEEWIACPMKRWNEDGSIVMLSYTFYMRFLSNETLEWRQLHCDVVLYILYGILVQWNTGMKTAPLWCCLIHFIWDSCPYMGFLSNESLEWRHLHCDAVLYILYGILVQWSAGMKTPPLWCCLIHFILDCLSNETLEWRQLHCDVVLYIL